MEIAAYACKSEKNFKELMVCFSNNEDKRLSQLAAWCASWAAEMRPQLIVPYSPVLIDRLTDQGIHDAVKRNALRILESHEIPEEYQGKLMNACFGYIENPAAPIALKAFSLYNLFNLSKIYPEIGPELKLIIETQWDNEGAAFRSRGRKILKALK